MRQIVTATEIDKWFESTSRDAQELLPHLVRKRIPITVIQGFGCDQDSRRRSSKSPRL